VSKRAFNHRIWLLIVVGSFLGSLLVAGCASGNKRKWLSIFFDGVPAEGAATNRTARAPEAATNQIASITPRSAYAKPAEWVEPVMFRHVPFKDEKCNDCHESKFSQRMKGSVKEVCSACHPKILPPAPTKHAPVESGECLSCHHPHQSTNKFLLVRTGKAMCFECHDDFLEKAKVKHAPVESGECLSCHAPHHSTNKFLLVRTGKAMCFECHDDFLEKAKVKHAPVESGECLSCHAPHHSTNKFLLVRSGKAMCFECHDDFLEKAKFQHTAVADCSSCHSAHKSEESALLIKSRAQLCLECHEVKDLAQSKGHAQIAKMACLQCHDPHVGQDKFLLKPARNPASGAPGNQKTAIEAK